MDSINDILSSLTPDDIDSLKSMAESVFGSTSQSNENSETHSEASGFGDFLSPDMLIKLSSIMNTLNSSGNSSRYKLIEALKPNLSKRRREKADEALQILKVMEILPIIAELNNNGDKNA